ncbi:MAG: hypothetical protein ACR2KB_15530 [Chitinophagaceae bacterium]
MRGDNIPPEELNKIEEGKDYGWPFVWGNREIDRVMAQDPDDKTRDEYACETEPAALTYTAHSAPILLNFIVEINFRQSTGIRLFWPLEVHGIVILLQYIKLFMYDLMLMADR